MVCRVIKISITGVLLKKPPKSHTIKYNKKCDLTSLTPSLCSLVLGISHTSSSELSKTKTRKIHRFWQGNWSKFCCFWLAPKWILTEFGKDNENNSPLVSRCHATYSARSDVPHVSQILHTCHWVAFETSAGTFRFLPSRQVSSRTGGISLPTVV